MSIITTNTIILNHVKAASIIDFISIGADSIPATIQNKPHNKVTTIIWDDSLYYNTPTATQNRPRKAIANRPTIYITPTQETKQIISITQPTVQITQSTIATWIAPQIFVLPSRFMSWFTSSQLIGQTALYNRDGQYTAINHGTNIILFQTMSGQTLESSTTGSNGSIIIILWNKDTNKPNWYSNWLNSKSLYIINQNDVAIVTGAHTIMMIASGEVDNQWGQSVIIIASFMTWEINNSDWNYIVYNHAGQVLKSGISWPTTISVRQIWLNNPWLTKPTTPAVYVNLQPVITTPQILTYKIHYTLSSQNSQGYYTLNTATCTTNGSMDVLWIEKRLGQNYFGIGIEINNVFGDYSYQVKKWDKLCCKVSTTSWPYQKAGGCENIQ